MGDKPVLGIDGHRPGELRLQLLENAPSIARQPLPQLPRHAAHLFKVPPQAGNPRRVVNHVGKKALNPPALLAEGGRGILGRQKMPAHQKVNRRIQ